MPKDSEYSVIVFDNKKVVGKFDNLYDAYNSLGEAIYDNYSDNFDHFLGEAIYDNYSDNFDHFLDSYKIDYAVEHDDI